MWLEEDTNAALALQAEEDATCACGQPVDESMRPENEGKYVASLVACFACAEIDKLKTDLADQVTDPGLRISVSKL